MANILLISHYLGCTGAPASLLRHAIYFKKAGHKVDIWSLGGGSLKEEYYKAGFSPIIIDKNDYSCIEELWKKCRRNYSLIICNTTETYKCVQLLKNKNIPLIWFIRETKLVDDNIKNNSDFADCFTSYHNLYTVSNYAADVIKKYNQNVKIINNSIADTFKSFTDIGPILRFGYIGSIMPVKGVDVLLKAFSKELDNGKNISLKLAGYVHPEFQYLIPTYQKYKQIEWLGEIQGTDKENFFNEIDVLVVPSLDEPFGLTVVEGCMKGKIVITTDKVGANHFIIDKESGFIVEANNDEAIFNAIEKILQMNKRELYAMQKLSRGQYLKYGLPEREEKEVLKMLQENINYFSLVINNAIFFLLSLGKLIRNLFYVHSNNTKKYRFFGLPLFSVKKKDNKRVLKILGVKFSYTKKKNNSNYIINQNIIEQNRILEAILDSVLLNDGCDSWQLDFLKHYFISRRTKKNEKNEDLWLVTITALYLSGNKNSALSLLSYYISIFGISKITNYAPLCVLAKEIGKSTDNIEKVINTYQNIINLRNQERFENLIKNAKSIAIVGRSPSIIGKSLGKEIDAHDIVIRFNNSDVSGKYKSDYGTKINVNVINVWLENPNDDGVLCIYKDYRIFNTDPTVAEKIEKDLSNNIDVIGFGVKKWVCDFSGLDEPTSGAIFICWVYKILGTLKNVDIYGFAFQDEKQSLGHFDGSHVINTDNHNMDAEMCFLKSFVKANSL